MEILKSVRKILSNLKIENPIVDVHYDEQDNIIGYVCSESFSSLSDSESQSIIWESLKEKLGAEELIKIHVIFHETPDERLLRISGDETMTELTKSNIWIHTTPDLLKLTKSNIWIHTTPDLLKYWMIIDVCKSGENEYKSIYLIVNGREKFKKGHMFVYLPEIIELMEFDNENEILDELSSKAFEYAETVIRLEIMNKYDELTKKGQWGHANIYNYVFQSFKMIPIQLNRNFFDEKESELLEGLIEEIDDCFCIKQKIQKCIKSSKLRNEKQQDLNR